MLPNGPWSRHVRSEATDKCTPTKPFGLATESRFSRGAMWSGSASFELDGERYRFVLRVPIVWILLKQATHTGTLSPENRTNPVHRPCHT